MTAGYIGRTWRLRQIRTGLARRTPGRFRIGGTRRSRHVALTVRNGRRSVRIRLGGREFVRCDGRQRDARGQGCPTVCVEGMGAQTSVPASSAKSIPIVVVRDAPGGRARTGCRVPHRFPAPALGAALSAPVHPDLADGD